MSLSGHGTVIARLRVRGASGDPLATQLRLSSTLSATDLAPAGFPPTVMIFIRALADPLPGRWRPGLGGQPPLAWRQAVGERINDLARRAARPAHGFVPDSAEAVLFMDRGELLACLARDWCSDAIAARWWWRSLLRDPDIARAVLSEWQHGLEYAPAAFQQLAESGDATRFVRRLRPVSAGALLAGMLERFGLTEVRGSLAEVVQRGAVPAAVHEWREPRAGGMSTAVIAWSSPADPFLRWVPEIRETGLGPEQRLVLGIALMLQRAPAEVRAPEFALDVARWAMAPARASEAAQANVVWNRAVMGSAAGRDGVGRGAASVRAAPHGRQSQTGPVRAAPAAIPPAPVTPVRQPEPLPVANSQPAMPIDVRATPARAVELRSACEPAAAADDRWIGTAHGGALFLINVGLFLGLYADFSQPAKRGLALPVWDFIALVGESLVGRRLRADPLWPLLAELAGRDAADQPGRQYAPPSAWRVPANWLTPFAAADTWEWSARRHRMQVRHPAGFVVLDVPVRGRDYRDALALELAPYRSAGLCGGVVHRAPPATAGRPRDTQIRPLVLRRWCDRLMPYLHARLQTALGTSAADDVGELLCACPARLRITATHLDARFALADLPIAVRLAGLDRDPGWVPAAGRYIRFHFD